LVWIKDLHYRHVFANKAFLDTTGLSLQSIMGLTDRELHSLQSFTLTGGGDTRQERFMLQDKQVIRAGVSVEVEDQVSKADGTVNVYRKRKLPWISETGEVLGLIGISTDITLQKLAERALHEKTERVQLQSRESKSLWEAAAVLTQMGYARWDHISDRYIEVNETYARLHGYSVEEYMSSFREYASDANLVHPDDRARTAAFYETADFTRQQMNEYRIITPLGETVHVRDVSHPTKIRDGIVIESLDTIQDITVQKLEQERYRLAAKQARLALKAKTAILRNVTHELRTPLNGILGMLFLVIPKVADPELAERLQFARVSAEKLNGLIDDILTVSDAEINHVQSKKKPVRISSLIRDVGARMRELALAKGLNIEVVGDLESEQTLYGDAERIQTVLVKMIDNAIKFSSEGEIQIQLEQLKEDEDRKYFQISVTDSGVGIAAENLEKIFEPFEQVESDQTRRFEGGGLGLAVAKFHVERMGGTISAESELGQGSRFWINVPLERKGSISQIELGDGYESVPGITPQRVVGLNVLVVGDDPLALESTNHILERQGYESFLASDSESAVDAAYSQKFDVVLLDMGSSDNGGTDVVAQLRRSTEKSATSCDVPVLAMTGRADVSSLHLHRIRDAGINGMLKKPFTDEQLNISISLWVDDPKQAALTSFVDEELSVQAQSGLSLDSDGAEIEETIDPSAVIQDQNLHRQFIDLFCDFLEDEIERLQNAAGLSDLEKVGKISASIRGSSRALGLTGISSVADQLNSLVWNESGSESYDQVGLLISNLEERAQQLKHTLARQETQ
jgi:PAS domain S-box-containing protein